MNEMNSSEDEIFTAKRDNVFKHFKNPCEPLESTFPIPHNNLSRLPRELGGLSIDKNWRSSRKYIIRGNQYR